MKILHIHQDYPDGLPYPYTRAVSNLIEATEAQADDISHFVLSINRTSNPFKIKVKPFDKGIAVVYWAIPLPYLYVFSMWLSSLLFFRLLNGMQFDVVHGHKLTCEGIFAYFLAKKYNIPYVLSVRGGSDRNNLTRLRQHIPFFAKIYQEAAQIFWVGVWVKKVLAGFSGFDVSRGLPLRNICKIDIGDEPVCSERNTYITAISYHQYKRKGIIPLIQAIGCLKQKGVVVRLDIYGGGDDRIHELIKRTIADGHLEAEVSIKGQVEQSELIEKMRYAKGFIMPSKNETFGMAYIEALSVGCPIVYMADTGIDGYFDGYNIGVRVVDQSVESISSAIMTLEKDAEAIDSGISRLLSEDYLLEFTGDKVANHYIVAMKEINMHNSFNVVKQI